MKAAFAAAPVPQRVMICAKLVRSSYALKKGYLPLSKQRKITPADHMSTAGDCCGYLRSTSGERKPGVPARGVFWWPLHRTQEKDCVSKVKDRTVKNITWSQSDLNKVYFWRFDQVYLVHITYSTCFPNESLPLLYVRGVVLSLSFFSPRLARSDIDLRSIHVHRLAERGCL